MQQLLTMSEVDIVVDKPQEAVGNEESPPEETTVEFDFVVIATGAYRVPQVTKSSAQLMLFAVDSCRRACVPIYFLSLC